MREVVQHSVYGEIVYEENVWTGKKTLTFNGVPAKQISKKEYALDDKKALLKGNIYSGVIMQIDGEDIQLLAKPAWYEILFAVIPFAFLMIWGNSPALCAIFPVVGGAIGGALGGIGGVISLLFMKKQKSPLVKALIGVAAIAVTVFVAFIVGSALVSMVS